MERETGAKIIIRGKGSVKEGKVARRDQPLPGEDEPLHAYVTATSAEAVQKALVKIKEVIKQGKIWNTYMKINLNEQWKEAFICDLTCSTYGFYIWYLT